MTELKGDSDTLKKRVRVSLVKNKKLNNTLRLRGTAGGAAPNPNFQNINPNPNISNNPNSPDNPNNSF